MNLTDLAQQVYKHNIAKGFHKKPKEFGTYLMMITSELSESLDAHRIGKRAKIEEYVKVMEGYTVEDSPVSFAAHYESHIKDSYEEELIDALIRILDLAGLLDIDFQFLFNNKMAYNTTRPKKHGKKY